MIMNIMKLEKNKEKINKPAHCTKAHFIVRKLSQTLFYQKS